jgi:hypothetical protein
MTEIKTDDIVMGLDFVVSTKWKLEKTCRSGSGYSGTNFERPDFKRMMNELNLPTPGLYVELLLNSVERCIAIRPCDKNNPNAIRWGRLKEGRWCASTLGCRGLAKTLFDIMEWDEDLRYRFRGQFLEQGDNKMMLFAFDEPEMIKVEEIVLPPKENTEEDEGETVKKKICLCQKFFMKDREKRTQSIRRIMLRQQNL